MEIGTRRSSTHCTFRTTSRPFGQCSPYKDAKSPHWSSVEQVAPDCWAWFLLLSFTCYRSAVAIAEPRGGRHGFHRYSPRYSRTARRTEVRLYRRDELHHRPLARLHHPPSSGSGTFRRVAPSLSSRNRASVPAYPRPWQPQWHLCQWPEDRSTHYVSDKHGRGCEPSSGGGADRRR